MYMVLFACITCRAHLSAQEADRGTIGWCPKCRSPYTVPKKGEDPALNLPPLRPRAIKRSKLLWMIPSGCGVLLVVVLAIVFMQRASMPAKAQANSVKPNRKLPQVPPAQDLRPELPVFDPPPAMVTPKPALLEPIKVIATDPIPVKGELVDETLYFGSESAMFYAIDTHSLKVDQRRLGQRFEFFRRKGTKLEAEIDYIGHPQVLAEFPHSIEKINPENIHITGVGGVAMPAGYPYANVNESTPMVLFEGRYYAASDRGVTVVERGKDSTYSYRSPLEGVQLWRIALLPNGPAGFDNTAVFTLDEHLCPSGRLINLNKRERSISGLSASLAGDGETMCFVTVFNHTALMQIWSLDGKQKLREIPVTLQSQRGRGPGMTVEDMRVTVVGDGYLFCGGELTWLSAGDAKPLQFSLPEIETESSGTPTDAKSRVEQIKRSFRYINNDFMPPVLVDGKVFVAHPHGNIYVFDASAFTAATNTGSRSAATNP